MIISHHAFERAELRLNLSPPAFARHVNRIKEKGRRHNEFSGQLRHYMDSLFFKYRTKEIWVYGEFIYPVNHDDSIPTVLRVPQHLKKYLKR